jgi:hypothetical protein
MRSLGKKRPTGFGYELGQEIGAHSVERTFKPRWVAHGIPDSQLHLRHRTVC